MIVYDIAVKNGINEINSTTFVSEYFGNLVVAMDALATNVAMNITISNNSNTTRRFLQDSSNGISLLLPTELQKVTPIPCPSKNAQITNTTLCQSVSAIIDFVVPDSADATTIQSTFDESLLQAVRDGELQTELDQLEWKTTVDEINPITVLTGLADVPIVVPEAPSSTPPREIQSTETLSSGQIAGIAIGAGAILSIILGYALMKRNSTFDDDDDELGDNYDAKPKLQEIGPDGEADIEKDLANSSMADSSIYTDAAQSGGGSGAAALAATTLGASQANYGGMTKLPPSGLDNDDEAGGMLLSDDPDRDNNINDDDDDGAASSNAGSSGWSSSAGISSLNTGSMDEMDIAAAAGATLAGIGLASAFSRNLSKRGGDDALGAAPRYVSWTESLRLNWNVFQTTLSQIPFLCRFCFLSVILTMDIRMYRPCHVINWIP
jgi:hypothetical protein